MVRRPQKQPVTYVRRPRRKREGEIFDLLSGVFVFLSLCFLLWFIYLFNFPNTQLNPFPPMTPTLPPTIALPLVSQTRPATQTLAVTTAAQATALPTSTGEQVAPFTTITPPGPSSTPGDDPALIGTAVPKSYYSYQVIGVPPVTAIQASRLNPTRNCDWMVVGGNVFDLQNRPAPAVLVQMGGTLNRIRVLETSLSGTALQYGQAGYEFTLAAKPQASTHSLWVRLVDQSMQPISQQVYFDTYEDCGQNLILVNFKQVR